MHRLPVIVGVAVAVATTLAQTPVSELPRIVMLGGKLLDADALRAAAGFSGRPK